VFNCIATQNTKDGFESELSYPRLRVLLQFDTQEFLNVLSMVSNMFVANSLKRFSRSFLS